MCKGLQNGQSPIAKINKYLNDGTKWTNDKQIFLNYLSTIYKFKY